MSALFRDRAIFKPFTRHCADPEASYDGYMDDDTEEKARTVRLVWYISALTAGRLRDMIILLA